MRIHKAGHYTYKSNEYLMLRFLVNLLGGLIAYTHQEKRPFIKWGNDGLPRLVFA